MAEKTKCTKVTIKQGNSVTVSNSKQDSSVTYGQHYVQKMPEYIEREALFKRLKEETHDYDAVGKYKEGIIKGLNIAKSIVNDKVRTPTADVVEVKHGEWDVNGINIHNNTVGNWRCSVCKCVSLKDSNYCPYCGAKMDLKEGAEE